MDRYFSEYMNPDKTKKEALALVKHYKGLQIEQDTYEFSNGYIKTLALLRGTIPVRYKGTAYHIPVCIWLMDTHPSHAPICYVKPTPDMRINVSKHVDQQGKIYLPYLHEWSPVNSNLAQLVSSMIMAFSETPPLYSHRKNSDNTGPTNNPSSSNSPYPTQSYMPMPGSNVNTPYPSYPTPSTAYPGYNPNAATGMYPPYPTPTPGGYPGYPTPQSTPYPTPYQPMPSTYPSMPVPDVTPPAPVNSGGGGGGGGTITDEHIKMSLKSAVEDKIRRKINEQTEQANAEIEILKQTESELNQGKQKLQRIFERINKEQAELERSITFLKDKENELSSILTTLTEKKEIDVDEAVTTTAPIYNQILLTFTEEAATEDTIYYMGEALRRGVIDLEVYLKHVRVLSRKQFMLRALLFKCYKHISYLR